MVYYPTVTRCPDEIEGHQRLVLNIIINGKAGDLKPFDTEKLQHFSDLEKEEVDAAVHLLAMKNLIYRQSND